MPVVKPQKPSKPRPDFPLTPHAGGKWCKKIGKTTYYFGSWGDPEGALREYQRIADSLQAGIDPRKQAGTVTVEELCNLYLHSQKQRADAGEIRFRTWRERRDLCERIADMLGRTTPVVALQPKHFGALRAELSRIYGAVGLRNTIVRIKSVFKWGHESRYLPTPVFFGPDFKPPKATVIRAARQAGPKRFIEAATIQKLLKGAGQPMKAMILLGINAGLGNRDLAALPLSRVDLRSDWLDYPREKTATTRRIPLWKETRKALADALKARPESELPNCFVTRFGGEWGWETPDGKFNDEVGKQFRKLVKRLGLEAPGLNFYALRHTFRTVADNVTRDGRAIELIMGHAGNPEDMGTHYIEHIDDDRLKAVTDAVHRWLFAKKK